MSANRSTLLNKISKANMMIVEYALESPEDYGRSTEAIAASLAHWSAHRDQLITDLRSIDEPE